MEDRNPKLNMDKILCKTCNEINKIKLFSNYNNKSITVSFICNHERNTEGIIEQVEYCLSCRKKVEQNKDCKMANHEIIQNEDLFFYCKKHMKKFSGYCEECEKNLCDECVCIHENIKSSYEYYFSFSQIENLLSIFEEVKNYINLFYSLDCNDKICKEFENYYNVYIHLYNNELFHANIVYNINLFYNFFFVLNQTKLIINGDFSISEINNIKDETNFFDSNFQSQFAYLLDSKEFNFKNILNLFLLSKRFNIKIELFDSFSNKINLLLTNNISELDDMEKNIFLFNDYFNAFKEEINNKKYELMKIQNEINYEILSIKLSKIAIPSNLKRKLISILQREIIKKYKDKLHVIKPNVFILNNIKKRYESFKKLKRQEYELLNLEEKVQEIEKLILVTNHNFIDNVYFEKDFEYKLLLNTFIYFTQKLHYQKSNSIHFSKNISKNEVSVNQIIPDISKTNVSNEMDNKIEINNNLEENNKNLMNNSAINMNNSPFINFQDYNTEQLIEYKKFLVEIKDNFNTSYKTILIKKSLNLKYIMDALFKNDFSNIIEFTEDSSDKEINALINKSLNELNKIPIIEEENQDNLNNIYSVIKSNNFLVEVKKMLDCLMIDRKYKNIIIKIKENFDSNNTIQNNILYKDLIHLLIKLGGFDERNAKIIIKLIKNYLYYSKRMIYMDKQKENYDKYIIENSELIIEINQLKKIKNYIQEVNNEIKYYNKNYEINEMNLIKNNFINKVNAYINESKDNNFRIALSQIQNFINGKNISYILDSLKEIIKDIKDIESNFYIDESLNLVAYCWGIQNGHDFIVDA